MSNSLKRHNSTGFTIVELLIVIIVIGILVAISVVAYNGVQKNALDKSVLSDVDGVSGEVSRYGTKNNGTYGNSIAWYSGSGSNTSINFTPSAGNIIDVVINLTDYCIRGYNPSAATYKTLAAAAIKESTAGVCASLSPSASAIAATPLIPNTGSVSLLAGTTRGYADGTGAAAQFNQSAGISTDSSGNIYVADTVNQVVRKITPSGVATTLAGSAGSAGYVNGIGTSAKFYSPRALVVDSSGNVYVADAVNNVIRLITPGGVVSTFAGSGTAGYVDGSATSAQFKYPQGIAIDSSGNLYASDMNNHVIRLITPGGVVSTFAGSGTAGYVDGSATSAQFNNPQGIAVDSSGNVYVGDPQNYVVRKITSSGVVSTFAGLRNGYGNVDGTGASARFKSPNGVTIDRSGNIYIADSLANTIRMITPNAVVTTLVSSSAGSGITQMNGPEGVAVDSNGNLYVANTQYSNIILVR